MENLRVFKTLKEKVGKLKLIKIAKYMILTVSIVALLASCGDFANGGVPPIYNAPSITQSIDVGESVINNQGNRDVIEGKKVGVIENAVLDEELQRVIEKDLFFSPSSNAHMQNIIDGTNVNYQHHELFNIEAALSRYNSMNKNSVVSSESFISNNRIDITSLKKTILNNNRNFVTNQSSSRFSEFSSAEFDKVFAVFVETLQYRINDANSEIDINEVNDKLKDLKLLRTNESDYGYISAEKVMLALNLNVIATGQNSNQNIDFLKKTVIHETNHFIQMHSLANQLQNGYSHRLGIAYEWKDLSVNPLYYEWYFEGAAESLMTESYGDEMRPITYIPNINALDSFSVSTILNQNVDVGTMSKISLQSDLTRLFDAFGCDTSSKRQELVKMMYAYDIIFNESQDFLVAYENANGARMDVYARGDYKNSLRGSIAQTLTKTFYSNLSTTMSREFVKINEIFSLISIFEADLSRFTWYHSNQRLGENEEFINVYVSIQNEFFEQISNEIEVPMDIVVRAYNAYNAGSRASIPILTLSDDKNKFLENHYIALAKDKRNTINEIHGALSDKVLEK